MARYYILLKKKGSKNYLGAIPTKKNATLKQLRLLLKKGLKKGLTGKIINTTQLKRLLRKTPKKRSTKKPRKR